MVRAESTAESRLNSASQHQDSEVFRNKQQVPGLWLQKRHGIAEGYFVWEATTLFEQGPLWVKSQVVGEDDRGWESLSSTAGVGG